ncbi:MAG TPA: DUF1499 domain-containing protein [Geminicoccaceae bacterium]
MTDPAADRTEERWRRITAATATVGLVLAIVAGLGLLVSGPGHRFGWWSFGTGFAIMRWSAYGGIAAAAVSAAALILAPLRGHRRGMLRALAGLVVGLITVGVPAWYLQEARSVPPIHDITTDTEDPPEFETILPLRAQAPNPATYGGPAVAAQQREGYPDIAPADYPVGTEAAFEAALAAARDLGWTVVAMDEAGGRIEAIDRTFWFGFADDIVIRIRPTDAGSRIDVRSVSRVGVSDMGTNAARIRAYLAALDGRIDDR